MFYSYFKNVKCFIWAGFLQWDDELILTRNSVAPASDYDGRVVKAAPPVATRRNHWAGDRPTSLVGEGVGSNPTRNQICLITFDLALNLGELDSSSIH